jgi:hypothetical protein
MFELIKKLLKDAWEWIKKIFVKVVNFIQNISGWFRDKDRLKKLKEKNNIIAVSIKEKMRNGDYNIVNCLFDEETNTLNDSEIIHSKDIDQKTKNNFGNQDMIILN